MKFQRSIQRSQNILDGLHLYRKPENHRFYGIFQDARTEKSSGNKKTMLFYFLLHRVYKKKLNKPEIALRLCKAPQCTKRVVKG